MLHNYVLHVYNDDVRSSTAFAHTEQTQVAIRVHDLVKRYDALTAVDRVSFEVSSGEVFGFLGPNGAGKTTTINILTGLARSDGGEVWIGGLNCTSNTKRAQHLLGVVPDESNLYPELSGFQNLCFCGALYGMRRVARETRARELLSDFDLAGAADRKFAAYSRGMKRRLTIAAGIMHHPPILFLDEPTTGIDVASARQVRQLISEMNQAGTTIFLTTHYIEEAERLCNRVAFIVDGRIVREDTVTQLMRQVEGLHIVEVSLNSGSSEVVGLVSREFPDLRVEKVSDAQLRLVSARPIRAGAVVVFLESAGLEVTEARQVRPSLEDVFVSVTGLAVQEMKRERERMSGGGVAG